MTAADSSIPYCYPDIYKTSLSIHSVFNKLDTSINFWDASIFQKVVRKNIRVMAAIFIFFRQIKLCHSDLYKKTSFFDSLVVQHTGYKYWFLDCFNFSENAVKYSGHGSHLNFFSSNLDLVTLISTKPIFRLIRCSSYRMKILIPLRCINFSELWEKYSVYGGHL